MLLHDKENESFESLEQLRGNTNVAILEMRLIKENHQKVIAMHSLEKHNGNLLCRARLENHFSYTSS